MSTISFLAISTIAALFSMSCSSNLELKDFEVVDGMMRSEYVKLDVSEQKKLLGKMTPEQRCSLMHYKLVSAIVEDDLSKKEKKEMKKLFDILSPELYTDTTSKYQRIILAWVENMKEQYLWDDDKLWFYTTCNMTKDELWEYEDARKLEHEFDFLQ